MSKIEERCRIIFEKLFEKKFPSCRPNFLMNPKTSRNLELDGYNSELEIAFERQGEQHYKFKDNTSLFKHQYKNGKIIKTADQQWIEQIKRDKYKKKVCNIVGVKLIIIPPQIKSHQQIIDFLFQQQHLLQYFKYNKHEMYQFFLYS
jgi:hypothetical protein